MYKENLLASSWRAANSSDAWLALRLELTYILWNRMFSKYFSSICYVFSLMILFVNISNCENTGL